jgi:4-hydroxy-2-oxoheptanedioate aldolase
MRANPLKHRKPGDRPALNGWLSIGSSYNAEIVAHAGFDSVTVDCQHGMMGWDTALVMLQAISTTRAMPLVRPSANDPAEIMRLLDAGAYGVICPMISTPDDARRFVASCRYPPRGARSFGPSRGLLYGGSDYFVRADGEILTLAMIETAEGLANLDAIVAVPELDGIYVGPNDLAVALGCPPVPESDLPKMTEAIERIRSATHAAGKMVGIFCSGGSGAARRAREGFDMVTPGNDAMLLKAALAEAVRQAGEQ